MENPRVLAFRAIHQVVKTDTNKYYVDGAKTLHNPAGFFLENPRGRSVGPNHAAAARGGRSPSAEELRGVCCLIKKGKAGVPRCFVRCLDGPNHAATIGNLRDSFPTAGPRFASLSDRFARSGIAPERWERSGEGLQRGGGPTTPKSAKTTSRPDELRDYIHFAIDFFWGGRIIPFRETLSGQFVRRVATDNCFDPDVRVIGLWPIQREKP